MSIDSRSGKVALGFIAVVLAVVAAFWTTLAAQRGGGTAPAAVQNSFVR